MSFYHTNPDTDAPSYITAKEIKHSLLGFDWSDTADEDIEILAETASRMIDSYTNQIFYPVQIVQEKKPLSQDNMLRFVFRTHYKPVWKVNDCFIETIPTDRFSVPLNMLDVQHQQGLIYVYAADYNSVGKYVDLRRYSRPMGYMVVSYDAGPKKVPLAIKRATALLVRNMISPASLTTGVKRDEVTNRGALKKVQSKSYSEEYDVVNSVRQNMKMSVIPETNLLFTSDIRMMLLPFIRHGIL